MHSTIYCRSCAGTKKAWYVKSIFRHALRMLTPVNTALGSGNVEAMGYLSWLVNLVCGLSDEIRALGLLTNTVIIFRNSSGVSLTNGIIVLALT